MKTTIEETGKGKTMTKQMIRDRAAYAKEWGARNNNPGIVEYAEEVIAMAASKMTVSEITRTHAYTVVLGAYYR